MLTKKERKRPQGEIRDKERTKLKLLNAVGEIIRAEGYHGLGVNKIAAKAGVNKKLIYRYFESVENLIEKYVREKDYWVSFVDKVQIVESPTDFGEHTLSKLLSAQFDFFYTAEEMQEIVLWEISEHSSLMRDIADAREHLGSELFKLSDPLFEGSGIDLRSLVALQVAGIYYLVLHAKHNGSTFCEIDIKTEEGRGRIKTAIEQISKWAFSEVKKNKC
ncbi:TetR/AcrR family transcriptional regulator [Olivibacter domesticus]|uniref:Transcriptional regulator, TetR family n=1 Tax=Olivibacter domesticus TaxID=407022 RepID=A0A1H7X0V3_OLID1|nr:TetR/AcrR family transcriptional regulator [Olivibacter domesticus]SEM27205.1 transcriptional regulator, TetR family [Olivibacter domesticus]